jgi:endoglucanase
LKEGDRVYDRQYLLENRIRPWKKLEEKGVGVHVGEFGAYNRTPHDVVLAWLGDYLSLWREAGWGWAMWNFRGSFGILDSGREDVEYEDFRGHKLDRKLLELLLRS